MKLQQHEITSAAQTCKLPGRIGIKSAAPTAVDTAPKVDAVPTKHHDKMICWCNLKIVPPRDMKNAKSARQQTIQSVVLR